MAQRSLKSWHHKPPKARRHLLLSHCLAMDFHLLIVLGCCLCLILWPQASGATFDSTMQDFGTVTAKGENIFMMAAASSINSGDDLGNAFPSEMLADDDDDNDDDDDDNENNHNSSEAADHVDNGNKATNVDGGKIPLMANARKEHRSKAEDLEMMQPERIMGQQQQQQQKDLKPKQLENNRHLRYQQIQQALREPITPLPPHRQEHHQHSHHHRHHHSNARQEEYKWPLHQRNRHHSQHQQFSHLSHSHHHRHQEHLHHPRRHNFTATATATTTTSTTLRPRYFDRDGLYSNPLTWIPTTQGPLDPSDEQNKSPEMKNKRLSNPHNHLFNDEDMLQLSEDDDDDREAANKKEEEFKRISLSLDANKDSGAGSENKLLDSLNFSEDDDDDDDDDYSYEDDSANNENVDLNKNRHPPTTAQGVNSAKINVKRYTNPIKSPYKATSSSMMASANTRKRQQFPLQTSYSSGPSLTSSKMDDSEDYDSNDDNSNDDDNFSDEKWNKIEHEHYRKQLQHQKAMQALRSRRPSPPLDNGSPPNSIVNKNNKNSNSKFSSSAKSASTAKRPIYNEDDTDNIYSRYYVPGSVTRKKEEELGTQSAVVESRRQYALQQRRNKAFASAHHNRIVKEGTCRLPQPRVERIRRDSWKIYTPHCTILHRCADDTGCCPTERQTCAPKRTKNVDLYFFVITLNETQGSIERLTFVNHTECHCVDRTKQRSISFDGDDSTTSEMSTNHIPYLRRATILNCNCPNLYEKILQEDGFCRCDCSSGNMGCDWLKRGMEHFSMNDRKCITEGRCKLPTCEYGAYMKKLGRCPRREERQVDTVDW
ncbi:uncharacterized protein LOC142227362 [Haematobia irritans]|uniref:uncharacterized protein LOC142227362 n=1 Tax=Haematobia irritans TaxID=7368 RepID=UPI003F4FE3E0